MNQSFPLSGEREGGFIIWATGSASSISLSITFLRVIGVEGFGDYWEGAKDFFQIGTKVKCVGINLGVGAGCFGTQTYTILFNLRPPDFWLRLRPRW